MSAIHWEFFFPQSAGVSLLRPQPNLPSIKESNAVRTDKFLRGALQRYRIMFSEKSNWLVCC